MIKGVVKELLGFAIRYSGAASVIREVFCRKRVTIVVYHDPSPESFAAHAEYLSRIYTFMHLDALVDALERHDWSGIPPKSLVVTFDDGAQGNFALLDTLKAYSITPSIYLCSSMVDTNRRFWWLAGHPDLEALKRLPHEEFLRRLREEADHWPEKEYPDRQVLNREELDQMASCVRFGSHTRFHPVLPNCSSETCAEEIALSRTQLEKLLGVPIEDFAYPNGDYGPRERACVERTGYRSARSLRVGWNGPRTDRFALRAMVVEDDASINVLCGQVSGVFALLRLLDGRLRTYWRRN